MQLDAVDYMSLSITLSSIFIGKLMVLLFPHGCKGMRLKKPSLFVRVVDLDCSLCRFKPTVILYSFILESSSFSPYLRGNHVLGLIALCNQLREPQHQSRSSSWRSLGGWFHYTAQRRYSHRTLALLTNTRGSSSLLAGRMPEMPI